MDQRHLSTIFSFGKFSWEIPKADLTDLEKDQILREFAHLSDEPLHKVVQQGKFIPGSPDAISALPMNRPQLVPAANIRLK